MSLQAEATGRPAAPAAPRPATLNRERRLKGAVEEGMDMEEVLSGEVGGALPDWTGADRCVRFVKRDCRAVCERVRR
ncbi:hypothetical protein GCM10010403_04970 [Glycomyces rutgersensis]|uniref:Uncharacterized protein n=1 Tax=Glycomyces rutgersensis TaxID=58115 RepID=A0ABN3F838_9ACTN